MSSQKHFNLGTVFGRIVGEIEQKQSGGNKPFISFQINVAGSRCGSARAFCRIWGAERIEPFLEQVQNRPAEPLFLKGFYGQYWDQQNTVYSNYTMYHWEVRASDPRAAFIVKGEVDIVTPVRGGHRLLLNYRRDGYDAERMEFWLQDEKLLDIPEKGQLVELKGYLRQETPEDDFGGSAGPVRSFVEVLRRV